ncbi:MULTISPECIES: hypothetical protein [unclassified Nocardia]|uniref:hypothetical protein n=1 Tax=unclassified Nocardia TaxID=2637762 RepID=UPI001CE439E9|nr:MULTISPECIES: hypothetical protein [unclassified Nocardia]
MADNEKYWRTAGVGAIVAALIGAVGAIIVAVINHDQAKPSAPQTTVISPVVPASTIPGPPPVGPGPTTVPKPSGPAAGTTWVTCTVTVPDGSGIPLRASQDCPAAERFVSGLALSLNNLSYGLGVDGAENVATLNSTTPTYDDCRNTRQYIGSRVEPRDYVRQTLCITGKGLVVAASILKGDSRFETGYVTLGLTIWQGPN